jgi:hypothetical protein
MSILTTLARSVKVNHLQVLKSCLEAASEIVNELIRQSDLKDKIAEHAPRRRAARKPRSDKGKKRGPRK